MKLTIHKWALNILIILISFITASCAVTNSTKPQIGYNVIFTPRDHIVKLIEQENFLAAEEVYERESSYFVDNVGKYTDTLVIVAKGLNKDLSKEAEVLLSRIDQLSWPCHMNQWVSISNTIIDIESFLAQYDSRSIIRATGVVSSSITQLRSRLARIKDLITQDFSKSFFEYPHNDATDFFGIYPLDKDQKKILPEFCQHLLEEASTADKEVIRNIHDVYGMYLDDKSRNLLGEYYYTVVFREISSGKDQKL